MVRSSNDLNAEIIRLLQEDGRLPYGIIASKLGVSAGTVRNRVSRMRDAGVAVVDPIAVDYASDAMLGIKVAAGVTPEAVANCLTEH